MAKNSKKFNKNSKKITKIDTDKALILENVNKKYKMEGKQTFQALFDVNISFEKGELVSIVGESGSGKSTLMNLIGGLDSDFTGRIIAGGENLHDLSESELDKYRKNKVGFVFQSFNLIPHLSILDNVTLALTLSNVAEHEKVERATKILTRLGLQTQLKKKPNQLSGGQRQRVAIARALINDPEIIIADEPTGALDSATSMQILQILKEIADEGKLVIMVTHSEKVAAVSSRVVEISDGRIISDKVNENYVKTPKTTQDALVDESPEIQGENGAEESENSANLNAEEDLAVSAENSPVTSEILVEEPSKTTQNSTKKAKGKKKFKNYKDKQNLSMYSAVRLSLHNMWASKVKNFLMAFGVGIGIASLILMMCFSSGLTDYINNTMKSFSDPTIVTVSKTSSSTGFEAMMEYNYFTDDEIETLVNNLNDELDAAGYDFDVTYGANDGTDSLSYGVQMYTITAGYAIYDPEDKAGEGYDIAYFNTTSKAFNSTEFDNAGVEYKMIYYLYTIPPYYTSSNVVEGEMATSEGGVMFSSSIYSLFEDGSITNDNGTAREVDIAINYSGTVVDFQNEKVTGIMDASVMSGFLVMYVDYDYFEQKFTEETGSALSPNTLYIQTPSEEISNFISEYLTANGYSGSIESTFATMFNSLLDVVGNSLVVLSCISLLVSAIMILVVLYMSVSERTKEIGVLKSIGARRKDIRRIFTSESFLIGLLSGIVGIVINLILTGIIAIVLNSLIGLCPISYRWWYFVLAIGVSIVISMLSGLWPSNKAAKLDPVESLRRE